jgi:2-dehydro-3-deoxyphosphooctonate aldolase (KDO 8-P synthase)
MYQVPVSHFFIGKGQPLTIISGPCVIESEEHCLEAAKTLKALFSKYRVNFIFKASYDKANRAAISSFRGVGLQEGLRILERVKNELDLPVTTDVHTPEEAKEAGKICDLIQTPAFLCRQTDLIIAAARFAKAVNVKKGQFMAPWDMKNVVEKIQWTGNPNIILTDRGFSFGYNNLVSDMRSIPIMQQLGVPVCFDATHSVQLPGGRGTQSGGEREFVPILAKAAIAAGANCLFIESHPDPKNAKSDAFTVMDFKEMPSLLSQLVRLYEIVQEQDVP